MQKGKDRRKRPEDGHDPDDKSGSDPSLQSSIDTQKLKKALLQSNLGPGDFYFGEHKMHLNQILTLESRIACGFCTASERKREEKQKAIEHEESSFSDKIWDGSLDGKVKDPATDIVIFLEPYDVLLNNLEKKYLTSRTYYNVKVVNDIIYNECSNIVSMFKDYLIFDDVSEFLKRYYTNVEAIERLPRIIEFYEKYSKVFPNYVNLPENKYMFKNIERKQKYWDSRQQYMMEQEERAEEGIDMRNSRDDNMFDAKFIKSVEDQSYEKNNDSTINHIVNMGESHCSLQSSYKDASVVLANRVLKDPDEQSSRLEKIKDSL
jgi:hypothetical protein